MQIIPFFVKMSDSDTVENCDTQYICVNILLSIQNPCFPKILSKKGNHGRLKTWYLKQETFFLLLQWATNPLKPRNGKKLRINWMRAKLILCFMGFQGV